MSWQPDSRWWRGLSAQGFGEADRLAKVGDDLVVAHHHPAVGWTPFDGFEATGWPMATIIRAGHILVGAHEHLDPAAAGQALQLAKEDRVLLGAADIEGVVAVHAMLGVHQLVGERVGIGGPGCR